MKKSAATAVGIEQSELEELKSWMHTHALLIPEGIRVTINSLLNLLQSLSQSGQNNKDLLRLIQRLMKIRNSSEKGTVTDEAGGKEDPPLK